MMKPKISFVIWSAREACIRNNALKRELHVEDGPAAVVAIDENMKISKDAGHDRIEHWLRWVLGVDE